MTRAPQTTPAPAVASLMEQMLYEVKKVVVGQDHFLERVLVALLAKGHLLVEGVPGLAKTLTVNTLAQVMQGSFKRIQFTPDLVPSDLVGTRIYNQKTGEFSTSLGPVFCNLLLADEINRAPAKVQSALLEVMQERQVTIAGETHKVPNPFVVMATQNPIETEGTYPAARGAGRPLHDEGAGRLSLRRGGIRHRLARHRGDAGGSEGGDHRAIGGAAGAVPLALCRSDADPVRGEGGGGDAQSGAVRPQGYRRGSSFMAAARAPPST